MPDHALILTALAVLPWMALAPSTAAAIGGGNDSSAVSSLQDLACDAAPSLMDFISCVKSGAPAASTELYTFPTVAQSQDFGFVVEQMMTDMNDGVFDCDAVVPTGLDEHYRVSQLWSNGRTFCALHEFLDADVDGYADLGWGTFLYAPDAANELDLQAPHMRVDLYTETEVVDLFERTYSRSALIAGAHSNANSAASICQGHMTDSDSEPYYEADASHNVDTFYVAAKAVAAYYGAEDVGGVVDWSGAHPDFRAVQFHAMGVSSCVDDHVFLSNGDGSSVMIGDGAERLATALQSYNPGWGVGYRGDGTSNCNLYGRDNTLSRYFNGVTDNGGNDLSNPICSLDGNHPAVSTRFIHVEQKRCISGTGCRYGDPDTIRTAANWSQAISDAFDAPTCTDGVQNGDEGSVDCGGSCPLSCSGPTCGDGVQNGTEEGIDCGGSCPQACEDACLLPGEGMGCNNATPCCSGVGSCSKGKASNRVCQ